MPPPPPSNPITSFNFINQQTTTSSKGKRKATKQDDDKWEREKKGFKPINAFAPPAPTAPQSTTTRNTPIPPKRTSRPTTTNSANPLPLPRTGIGNGKRILATQQEQDEWSHDLEQEEGQGSKQKKRKTSSSSSSSQFKPITSFKRSALPLATTSASISLNPTPLPPPPRSNTPQQFLRPPRPPLLPSKLSTPKLPSVPPTNNNSKPFTSVSLLSQSSALYSALKNPQNQLIKSESKPVVNLDNSKKLSNTVPTLQGVNDDKKGVLDGDTAMEDGEFEWESPKKKGKNGGYLPSGMASRASSILSATKTDHTLWLHDLSRKLLNLPSQSQPTSSSNSKSITKGGWSRRLLGEALQPELRLIVLSILSPSSSYHNDGEDPGRKGGGGGSKTILARCRLDLSPIDSPPFDDGESELDLSGLVLFSLHHRNTSTSTNNSSFIHPQAVPSKPSCDLENRAKRDQWNFYVPLGPSDLRMALKEGSEVWVLGQGGGYGEVELNEERETWKIGSKNEEESVKEEEENRKEQEGERDSEMEVRWEAAGREERELEEKRRKKRERVKKGLVVTKFGILV
ncbi:hypothetical protein JCM5353_000343 [Sporobolomyces roseus]